jgi:hypothetical protein
MQQALISHQSSGARPTPAVCARRHHLLGLPLAHWPLLERPAEWSVRPYIPTPAPAPAGPPLRHSICQARNPLPSPALDPPPLPQGAAEGPGCALQGRKRRVLASLIAPHPPCEVIDDPVVSDAMMDGGVSEKACSRYTRGSSSGVGRCEPQAPPHDGRPPRSASKQRQASGRLRARARSGGRLRRGLAGCCCLGGVMCRRTEAFAPPGTGKGRSMHATRRPPARPHRLVGQGRTIGWARLALVINPCC